MSQIVVHAVFFFTFCSVSIRKAGSATSLDGECLMRWGRYMQRREAVRRLFAANQPVERVMPGPDLSEDGQKEPVAGYVVSFAELDEAARKLALEPSFLHG